MFTYPPLLLSPPLLSPHLLLLLLLQAAQAAQATQGAEPMSPWAPEPLFS